MSTGVITLGVTSCSMKLQTRTENSGATALVDSMKFCLSLSRWVKHRSGGIASSNARYVSSGKSDSMTT